MMSITFKKFPFTLCLVGFVAALLSGCATTTVSNREELVTGPIPRPATIWVYNFAATASDVPSDSVLAGEDLDATPQTQQQIAMGQKFGSQIASELVQEINAMGMWAQKAGPGMQPQVNDIIIRGYILSVNPGNETKRVMIGFGSGKSTMSTLVEGFQVTPQGLRRLGQGDVNAGGNDSPGMALGVATFLVTKNPVGLIVNAGAQTYGEMSGSDKLSGRAKATAKKIAEALKKRFEGQGWIN